MSITIAAIVVGIGVDDCIHYVHRYMKEFPVDRDYRAAMYRCHDSIGRAMYYTTLTVVIGFSTLMTAVLVFMLSLRLRKREIETMHRIGGAKHWVIGLLGTEIAVVLLLGVGLAGVLTLLVSRFGEQLIRLFIL